MLSLLCKVKSPGGESEQLHLSVVAYYPVTTIGAWEYRAYLTFGIDSNEIAISVLAVGCYHEYIRVDDLPGLLSLHLGAKMARDAFFISAIVQTS